MKKTHIYVLIAFVALFGIIALIKGIIKFNKNKKEKAAWKICKSAEKELNSGKYGNAISSCEKALPDLISSEKKGTCLGIYGQALLMDKSITEGKETLLKAIRMNPKDFRARFVLAKFYYDEAKNKPKKTAEELYEKSLEQFNEASQFLELDNIDKREHRRFQQDIKFYQGDILEKFKNFGEAKLRYKEILDLGEKYPDYKTEFYDEVKRRFDLLERE